MVQEAQFSLTVGLLCHSKQMCLLLLISRKIMLQLFCHNISIPQHNEQSSELVEVVLVLEVLVSEIVSGEVVV